MPTRSHHWPPGHWDWLIHLPFKHGIRCGQMIYVGGQVDKDDKGLCLHLYDLKAQTAVVMKHINTVLAGFGADHRDVVKLVAFYVNDGTLDEAAVLAGIANGLEPGSVPAITLVPLPWLAYSGMMIEIEAVAMLGEDGGQLDKQRFSPALYPELGAPLFRGVRCGELIHVSGQVPRDESGKVVHPGDCVRQTDAVMESVSAVLAQCGATLEDVVKLNVYYADEAGAANAANWREVAEAGARYFNEPGPCASAVPLPWMPPGETIRLEVVAMLGRDGRPMLRSHYRPEGHWDWPFHLPFVHGVKCGEMVFIGGQVAMDPRGNVQDDGDLIRQTHITMQNVRKVLAGFGLTLDDVVKNNTFYRGTAGPDAIVANQRVRAGYYAEPGPATTGIPLPSLALAGLMTQTEVIAMTR
jgi:enamine deaminase RidA (YjgF/YER057c/UK114 family)